MKIFRKTSPRRDRFLEEARSHLGYKTRPSGLSDFGAQTGYSGHAIPWSGSFIDVVARAADLIIPSCTYTPSGLAEFAADGRLVSQPAPGDIVFYAFPTAEQFGMPHVGIVARADDFLQTGHFVAIEAQVASGLPRASTDRSGVFERPRWRHDVIAFARPDFDTSRPGIEKKQTGHLLINESKVRPGKANTDVQTVQVALSRVAGLDEVSGVFDASTQQAYSRWQRQIGYVHPDCTGTPDRVSLKTLGDRTGVFGLKLSGDEN